MSCTSNWCGLSSAERKEVFSLNWLANTLTVHIKEDPTAGKSVTLTATRTDGTSQHVWFGQANGSKLVELGNLLAELGNEMLVEVTE